MKCFYRDNIRLILMGYFLLVIAGSMLLKREYSNYAIYNSITVIMVAEFLLGYVQIRKPLLSHLRIPFVFYFVFEVLFLICLPIGDVLESSLFSEASNVVRFWSYAFFIPGIIIGVYVLIFYGIDIFAKFSGGVQT